jgi:hypothetical protein
MSNRKEKRPLRKPIYCIVVFKSTIQILLKRLRLKSFLTSNKGLIAGRSSRLLSSYIQNHLKRHVFYYTYWKATVALNVTSRKPFSSSMKKNNTELTNYRAQKLSVSCEALSSFVYCVQHDGQNQQPLHEINY